MYDKLTYEKESPIPGGFNDPPPNFEEITEEEFSNSGFFIYPIRGVEYRLILSKNLLWDEGGYLDVKLFHFSDGTGFGISPNRDSGKVRYFRYGCKHEWTTATEEDVGRKLFYQEHGRKCEKCGHIRVIDSSG